MGQSRRKHSDVINALNSSKSDRQIAKDLNVHHATVWAWRKTYNMPRKRTYHEKGEVYREALIEMLKSGDMGVSMAQMVAKLEIDRRKIYWILRELCDQGNVMFSGRVKNGKWYWLRRK